MKEILRALRLENGLTQKELALKINSTTKNIWNYEKGLATPPYDILAAYADYFDVTTDYLIGRTDDFGARTAASINSAPSYSIEERELIEKYRNLPDKLKELVRSQIEIYSSPNELIYKADKKV